jgi:hypothetical protein
MADGDDIEQTAKPPQSEADAAAAQADLEKAQNELLNRIASATFTTIESKVAWLLNNYPDTRNSDVALQLAYWDTFEDEYHGGAIERDDLYRFARLNTLTRARATIQNKLKLFQASPEIRSRRGTLSAEEKKSAAKPAAPPMYAVYADESGKTQQHYVVGSLWVLHGPETYRLIKAVREWRDRNGIDHEFHFTNLASGNLERYRAFVGMVLDNGAAVSFKSATIDRAGIGSMQDAFKEMFYQLTARGIDHEHESGRAPLPRSLQMWKDEEEEGYDKLLLATVEDRLTARFQDRLVIDVMRAVPSKENVLIQVADLFTGAVNRMVNPPNPPPQTPGAKDEFARYLLGRVGWNPAEGDMAVRLSI